MKLHVELYAIEQVEENLHHANEAQPVLYTNKPQILCDLKALVLKGPWSS